MKRERNVFLLSLIVALMFIAYQLRAWGGNIVPPIGNPEEEPTIIRVTTYSAEEGARCSTGCVPHYGVIAAKPEWIGKAICLYSYEMQDGKPVPVEMVGSFTVLDTGAGIDTDEDGKGDSIKKGWSLDVYFETTHQADEFRSQYGDYLLMILVDGKG